MNKRLSEGGWQFSGSATNRVRPSLFHFAIRIQPRDLHAQKSLLLDRVNVCVCVFARTECTYDIFIYWMTHWAVYWCKRMQKIYLVDIRLNAVGFGQACTFLCLYTCKRGTTSYVPAYGGALTFDWLGHSKFIDRLVWSNPQNILPVSILIRIYIFNEDRYLHPIGFTDNKLRASSELGWL